MALSEKLDVGELNELVEYMREYFDPKTELANKLPNISEVADNTSVTYLDSGKRVIAKAIDGNFVETYRET